MPDGATNGQRRDAWGPPAFMCDEILTGDRWGRRTQDVLDRAAFQHAAAGFDVVMGPAFGMLYLQIQNREPTPSYA